MEQRNTNKGQGSFCIPTQAISILLHTGKRAKWLIPAYLKIAAHTESRGMYSTAGRASIRKYLRMNKPNSIKVIDELCEYGLIYTSEQWEELHGLHVYPKRKDDRRQTRHIVQLFDEEPSEMLWFSTALANGIGQFKNPLRSLADCGPDAARMFLYFHREYDNLEFNAFNPLTTVYKQYYPVKPIAATNYMITAWEQLQSTMSAKILTNVFPDNNAWGDFKDEGEWDDYKREWDAFYNLEAEGLIYEMATVISSPVKKSGRNNDGDYKWGYVDLEDAGVVYELANLDRVSDTGKLHESIVKVVSQIDNAPKGSSVYSILKTGSNNSVIGLFKPRFAVTNKKNAYVEESLGNIAEDIEQPTQWLKHFINTKGLNQAEEVKDNVVELPF